MPKLLVTGFDAFGGMPFNPSEAILERLSRRPPMADTRFSLLPTRFEDASATLLTALVTESPSIVVMFGLARSTQGLRLERYAHNRIRSEKPDNAGVLATGRLVVQGGPTAYETTLDVDALADDLREAGHRTHVSTDAGGYVCSHVYYTALHWVATRSPETAAVFVHVPWAHEPVHAADFARSAIDLHEEAARAVIERVLAGTVRTV